MMMQMQIKWWHRSLLMLSVISCGQVGAPAVSVDNKPDDNTVLRISHISALQGTYCVGLLTRYRQSICQTA